MASIRARTSTAGVTTWAVLYRHGKRQTSRTFVSQKAAEDFKALVDVLGPDKALKALEDDLPDDRLTVDELAEAFFSVELRPVIEGLTPDLNRGARLIRYHLRNADVSPGDRAELAALADHLDRVAEYRIPPDKDPR